MYGPRRSAAKPGANDAALIKEYRLSGTVEGDRYATTTDQRRAERTRRRQLREAG
jgi:hypothetical protein